MRRAFPGSYVADELAAGALVAIAVRGMAPLWRDSALVRTPRSAAAPVVAAMITALQMQGEGPGAPDLAAVVTLAARPVRDRRRSRCGSSRSCDHPIAEPRRARPQRPSRLPCELVRLAVHWAVRQWRYQAT